MNSLAPFDVIFVGQPFSATPTPEFSVLLLIASLYGENAQQLVSMRDAIDKLGHYQLTINPDIHLKTLAHVLQFAIELGVPRLEVECVLQGELDEVESAVSLDGCANSVGGELALVLEKYGNCRVLAPFSRSPLVRCNQVHSFALSKLSGSFDSLAISVGSSCFEAAQNLVDRKIKNCRNVIDMGTFLEDVSKSQCPYKVIAQCWFEKNTRFRG